ncbi:aminopeptidase N [Glaciecola sp. KUL10]|uniref:aminopeptidase N n=1 Tax=Glaciecola sp. (strain KUL10) TaxID=2161813 RepID=UPI000D788533|nr:aminopeptidase N [Glaciecola sp. KUL10]GBL02851.1 aminopeptidase N [Glaciecola sp. KUL10]
MSQTNIKRREDYLAPSFFIDEIELTVELEPHQTKVKSILKVRRNPIGAGDLVLDGEGLELKGVFIDGRAFSEYEVTDTHLILPSALLNESFELNIENLISPKSNTSLEGLYLTDGSYCTQCEAEGFRKITYFLDRPDVLSIYTCNIISSDKNLKYLLSNGNKTRDKILDDGRRLVTWHDPHKKPCYLFALVAGDFDCLADDYMTHSGRSVKLELFVEKGRLLQGRHALDSLKKSMRWDEETYGLEYDLDIYMIVAVDFFNMGAMENKGLNVFNSKYVLAAPDTATDQDYFNIEAIIAHEYFHNWTGNRVTCRDWFQLSLKEGLTVFRDQSFSADMFNPLSTRIDQVKVMKEHQFAEDAGPMSHPIRPDEVIEMNNFYTVTVYDKGAEVIRMMHTILGKDGFRKGMDLYFLRHDGQAVTCDDFVAAMEDANAIDLTHFKLWYSQSGTPQVKVSKSIGDVCELNFEQINIATADQSEKHTMYIPIALECLTEEGKQIVCDDSIFVLDKRKDTLLVQTDSKCFIPVLLSDFSSPIKIDYPYTDQELLTIATFSKSDYSKWDAIQQFFLKQTVALYYDPSFTIDLLALNTLKQIIDRNKDKPGILAELINVPSTETILLEINEVDPLRVNNARQQFLSLLSDHLKGDLIDLYHSFLPVVYEYSKDQINIRKLKNNVISLLANAGYKVLVSSLIEKQYFEADNMTDKLGALKAAQQCELKLFDQLLSEFEQSYQHDAVVMDKWFTLQANTYRNNMLSHLDMVRAHNQYSITNPNKVRSVIGSFAFYNTQGFHAIDGSGYKYVADYLMELDNINPQVASRIVTCLISWKKFDKQRQGLIKTQLGRLLTNKELSKDLFEKVSKSLASD